MLPALQLNNQSDVPLYRQVFEQLKHSIESGQLIRGTRLPPTRELAGRLGLNRTTVSAAYQQLEHEGLISGQVGRGSFVTGAAAAPTALDWSALLNPGPSALPSQPTGEVISFASSRPSELLFPLDEFRATCNEVLRGPEAAAILQLGSPSGYAPLRHYLAEAARAEQVLHDGDDLIITSGCQQALDLLVRSLLRPGDAVVIEDPVYPGARNLLADAGARITGVPVGPDGLDLDALDRALERERAKLIVVASNFQNPTGATLPLASREALLRIARAHSAILVENDIYGDLRYSGDPLPPIKKLDTFGGSVLLRSFSKVAFPGLRVGWAIAPRPLIERMRQAKQISDLHTDQLSQAVLLRFAQSGRLEQHRRRMLLAGAERLDAALAACRRCLPTGAAFTAPRGGMNLWVRLPDALDSGELLPRAQREGVTYLPGRYFAVSRVEAAALRLSFAGLDPRQIDQGLETLGRIFRAEAERVRSARSAEPAPALV